ncbi:MAG: transposase family protein, partial [Mesoflavibacter sp.]|nr:transposase family protein [Mesoflavibacter sp.]
SELVMVLVDYLTRYTWAYPITNKKAETVARVLVEKFYPAAGIAERVITDRGTEFTNKLSAVLDEFYGTKRSLTTAYHPKSDGRVERMNQTLLDMLSKVTNAQGGRWQSHLGTCLLAYNCSVHSSTGLSPYQCLYGRPGIIPSSSVLSKRISPYTWTMESWGDQLPHNLRFIWRAARQEGEKAAARQKAQYDKTRDKTAKIFVDDRVWLFQPSFDRIGGKLSSAYSGPFLVEEVSDSGMAVIRLCEDSSASSMRVNLDRLSKVDPAIPDKTTQTTVAGRVCCLSLAENVSAHSAKGLSMASYVSA